MLAYKPCLHESSNPGSTHFRSRTEFQSTNGCGLSQSGLGGVHTGGESGLWCMVCKTSCNSQGFVCFKKQALSFNFTSFSFVSVACTGEIFWK